MAKRLPVEIFTNAYLRSHGAQPKGRGGWMFLVMDGSNDSEFATISVPHGMTLSDAKVWARAHVRETFPAELGTGLLYLEVAP